MRTLKKAAHALLTALAGILILAPIPGSAVSPPGASLLHPGVTESSDIVSSPQMPREASERTPVVRPPYVALDIDEIPTALPFGSYLSEDTALVPHFGRSRALASAWLLKGNTPSPANVENPLCALDAWASGGGAAPCWLVCTGLSLACGACVANVFVPDPIPLLDEIALCVGCLLAYYGVIESENGPECCDVCAVCTTIEWIIDQIPT